MPDLLNLADEMDDLLVKLGVFGNKTSEAVASTILKDLTEVTPVDSALAVSNWVVTLDTPLLGGLILAPIAASPRGRVKNGKWTHKVDPVLTAQANVPQTFQAGLAVIKTKQPGQALFITNNVPYINELNQGSSSQAPAGFVDRAVILGEQVVKTAKLP